MGAKTNIFNFIVVLRMDMTVFNVRKTVQAVQTTGNVLLVSQINGETFVNTFVQVVTTIVT